jgi:ABC-2 type transport system permease protein
MGLAREREMGTLEQVLVTPIQPIVLLAGKMTPFLLIGLLDVLLALTAMSWIFGVPVRGPLAALAVGAALYLCTTLGVGLLVSTISATQQQAFLAAFLFVLPAALLSGIMTPIRAMPGWLQAATRLNPLRWFAELVRGVLVRGAGFVELWPHLLALALFGAAILGLATARFRRRLG